MFLWLGISSVVKMDVGTRYNATVVHCHGGRYNYCDVVVHTPRGDIPASATLDVADSDGSTIRVNASGPYPPWRYVTEANSNLSKIVTGLLLLAGVVFTVLALVTSVLTWRRSRLDQRPGA